MESWESKPVNDVTSIGEQVKAEIVRETALLDDTDSPKLQCEQGKEQGNKTTASKATENFIHCHLRENVFMPETDVDIEDELEFAFNQVVRETDLTDPFEIDDFKAKFIDIDTSFSEDESKVSLSPLSFQDRRNSTETLSYDEKDRRSSTQSNNTSGLLKATISELERALSDTKKLLASRDDENARLRLWNTRLQKELDVERGKVAELTSQLALERNASDFDQDNLPQLNDQGSGNGGDYALRETLKFLEESLVQKEKEIKNIKNLNGKTGMGNSDSGTTGREGPSCKRSMSSSSASEVDELKIKIREQEKELIQLREKMTPHANGKTNCQQIQFRDKVSKLCDRDVSTQLRLKFLRDAFFYYMIDFHSDEQIKAILAILEYEDKRQDIIFESHKMRQLGKRFTVTKVSSRCLTFVQEEIR